MNIKIYKQISDIEEKINILEKQKQNIILKLISYCKHDYNDEYTTIPDGYGGDHTYKEKYKICSICGNKI